MRYWSCCGGREKRSRIAIGLRQPQNGKAEKKTMKRRWKHEQDCQETGGTIIPEESDELRVMLESTECYAASGKMQDSFEGW